MTGDAPALSPEFALLAACALRDDAGLGDVAETLVQRPGFDWDRFVHEADFHGVEQVSLARLEHALPGVFPATHAAELRHQRLQEAALYATQARATARLVEALAHEGIPALVLKGAAQAAQLYHPTPEVRGSSDIDLLIPAEHLQRSDDVLQRAGMAREWPAADPPAAARPMFMRLANVFDYRGPVSGELVELHFRATLNPHALPATFEELWAGSEPVDTGHGTVRALGGPLQTFYLCHHVLCQLPYRLKWFGDVARALRRAGAAGCAAHVASYPRPLPLRSARLTDEVLDWLGDAVERTAARTSGGVPASADVARIARSMVELRGHSTKRTLARLPLELNHLLFVLRQLSGWRSRAYELLLALSDPRDAVSLQLGPRFAIIYALLGPVLALGRFLKRQRAQGSPAQQR